MHAVSPIHDGMPQEAGGSRPPVVLVHGLLGSQRQWDQLDPVLSAAGYACFTPDLHGHGRGPRKAEAGGYHIDELSAHFSDWMADHEFARPPVLVGHSLGAYLSVRYALDGPAISGLFLSNPFLSEDQLTEGIRKSLENLDFSKRMLRRLPFWGIRALLKLTAAPAEKLEGPVLDQVARDYKRLDPDVLDIPQTLCDLIPEIGRIAAPVLVAWGAEDQTLQPETFPALCDQAPHAARRVLPGGHNPHMTHPEAYLETLLEFLGGLEPDRIRPSAGQRRPEKEAS